MPYPRRLECYDQALRNEGGELMIPGWLERTASGRLVIVALVVWIGFGALIFNPLYTEVSSASGGLLDETFGFTHEVAREKFERLGEAGRSRYQTFALLDCANALLFGIFGTLALVFSLSRLFKPGNFLRLLAFLPLVICLLDLIESALLLSMLSSFPEDFGTVARIASPLTMVKLVLAYAVIPMFVLSYIALAIKVLVGRRRAAAS